MSDVYDPGIEMAPLRTLMTKWYRISERLAANEVRIKRLGLNGQNDAWLETCKRNRTYQRRRKRRLEFHIVDYVESEKWRASFPTDEESVATKVRQAKRRVAREKEKRDE